jgi:hypothetical protein
MGKNFQLVLRTYNGFCSRLRSSASLALRTLLSTEPSGNTVSAPMIPKSDGVVENSRVIRDIFRVIGIFGSDLRLDDAPRT